MMRGTVAGFRFVLVVLVSLSGTQVLAQEGVILEEILVTAQKREQSIQDVPISITAFTASDIEEYRIRDVSDYVAVSPNVSYPETGEIGWSQVVIRGMQNFGGDVNAFGVYLDEFNLSPSGLQITIDPDLLDVERIEVLRGPQGVAFGRNVIAGAVNITTRKPGDRFEADALLDYGRYDTVLMKGGISTPIVENVLAGRVTGYYSRSGGFIEDIGPAGNTNDADDYGGRIALRFTGIDALTADVAVTVSSKSRGIPGAVPGPVLPPDAALFGPFFGASPPIDAGEGRWPDNRDRVSTDFPTEQSIDSSVAQLRLDYDLGVASLISITGYIDAEYEYLGEADMTAGDYTYIDQVMRLESFSQELRLQSHEDGGPLQWLAGAIYSSDQSHSVESFGGGVDGWDGINTIVTFVANPARADTGLPPLPLFPVERAPLNTFGGSSDAESYAAFAEAGYDLRDEITLTAGLRYTRDTIETDFFRRGDFTPPGLLAGVLEPFLFEGTGRTTYDAVTPRVTLNYRPSDDVTLYATASQGYKSGGFNAEAAAFAGEIGEFDFTFDPEEAWNYEVGAKGTMLDRQLRFSAAAFLVDWSDVQVTAFDLDTLSSLTQNAAKAVSKGVEAEFSARPVEWFTFSGGVGYLDAEIEDFTNAVVDGAVTDVSGNRLPYAPQWSANVTAQIERTLPDFGDSFGFARVEHTYRSSQYDDIANRPEDRLPSYRLWNLRAGIERGRYRATVYVENLFESEYHLSPTDVQARLPLSGDLVDVHPRLYGVTLSYRY